MGVSNYVESTDRRLAIITFADTGGGFDPNILDRVFEPFVTTKAIESGLGLGLHLCRERVFAMHGWISARNGPLGALVTIELPIADR